MLISLIAAMDEQGVIGAGGHLPWHLPADLRWFRAHTLGKPVIMGRVTHESIGRPLPRRENIVVTRRADYTAQGCRVVHTVEQALAAGAPEVMIIGGASLYAALLPRAGRMYLTRLHHRFEGDARFPEYERRAWRVSERHDHEPDHANPFRYSFLVLERVSRS